MGNQVTPKTRFRRREYVISTSSGDHIYISALKSESLFFEPYDPDVGEPPTLYIGGLGGTEITFEDSEVTFEEVKDGSK